MKLNKPKTEYDTQAETFLTATGTTIQKDYQGHRPYFPNEKESRGVWSITITRANPARSCTFLFGNSILDSHRRPTTCYRNGKYYGKSCARWGYYCFPCADCAPSRKLPSDYDILAGLYMPVGTLADFCADFGYSEDSVKDRETYFRCQNLAAGLERVFTAEELELLQEIA